MITFAGADEDAHNRMAAISPSEDVDGATWKLGDNLANGDSICSVVTAVGQGFTGDFDITLVRPASSTGDSSVRLYRRYTDAAGTLLDSDETGTLTITTTPNDYSISLDPAPAGTTQLEIGLLSKMNPPGDPVRINKFQDPRATNVANFYTRFSWALSTQTAGSDLPFLTGLRTYAQVQATGNDTGTGRGINLYESTDRSSPLGNAGYPLVGLAGQTITISAYVYATKACTIQASARGYAGTTWKGSVQNGTASAITAATWTRYSVAYTVPSDATDLCVTFMATNSVAWVSGDQIRVTAVLFENGATLNPYFDGTSAQLVTGTKSSKWEGVTNNSNSLLWAAATPGGTTVQATDSTMTYSAQCTELIGVALERDLRRSVADVFNSAQSLITAGTPALLRGQLTFLCASLAEALGVDAIYRLPGLVTLGTTDEMNGLAHRAVGVPRIGNERPLNGRAPYWTLVTDFREQVS